LKASNFREIEGKPYTRVEYIDGVPSSKIVKFTMGNTEKEFDYTVELLSLRDAQIRHKALEAARVAANRLLELKLGRQNYMLKIVPYPHHVLREHKVLAIAQADRFQEGMRRAYGTPVGTAARVERGDTIIIAQVPEEGVKVAKEALTRAGHKLPITCRSLIEENN
jgi:large subunit ribosomal protein L10e